MDNKIGEVSQADEANGNFDRSWREEKWGDRNLSVAAHDFAKDEKEMTIRQAIMAYKKAILWCLVISTCVIMEGYDTNLLGNFYAYRKHSDSHSMFLLTMG
jgi:SP family general alpha glucoside:H+ symporter-like MFS transporter